MFYQKLQCIDEQKLPPWSEDIGPDDTLLLRTQEDVDAPVGQQVTIQDVVAKEEAKEDGTTSKGENDDTQIQIPAMPLPLVTQSR
eukprot:11814852-Ditylum_brightwellii.AAC.1